MHDDIRNKQKSTSANMKTVKSRINFRKRVLGLNYPDLVAIDLVRIDLVKESQMPPISAQYAMKQ